MLRNAFGLTDQGARDFRVGVFFCAVANIVLMMPMGILFLLVNDFVNHHTTGAPLPSLPLYAAAVVLALALMVLTQWGEYANTYHKVYAESARKRIGIAEHLRKLPLSFFGRRDLSDLTNTIMKDCADQERMFMHVMPQLFGTGISTLAVVICMFFFDWRLSLAAFWALPFAFGLMAASSRYQQRKAGAMEDARLVMIDGVQEYLDCAQEIRAANRMQAFLEGLSGRLDGFERAQTASELITGVCITSAQTLLKLGMATTIFVGALMLVNGQVDFMLYFAFLLVVTRVYDPINVVLQSIAELLGLRLSVKRTNALAAEPVMTGTTDFAPRGHDVTFENVSFSYAPAPRREAEGGAAGAFSGEFDQLVEVTDADLAENVLSDVSFVAREGEVTALVGPSGGGKSTCAKLAARFWDVDSGRVLVGGVDVSTVDPEVLLRDFSVVFQDVVLFDESVLDNIRLGRRDATDEEVLAAARAALCDEFVRRLPEGYATKIGENGARLSGGERQRVSIARALLKGAPIVLLDEATASLDVEGETQVQQALSRLLADRTVLVIAHRMRTVMSADKVVVLAGGKVAEQGSPQDLLTQNGTFARMVHLQS